MDGNATVGMTDQPDSMDQVRLSLLRRAIEADPTSAKLLYRLADGLAAVGPEREFAEIFRRAYLIEPSLRPHLDPAAAGDAAAIQQVRCTAESLVRHGVRFSPVIAAIAITAALHGDRSEVARLIDYDRFFRIRDLGAEGCDDRFNRTLADEIRLEMRHHTLDWTAIREARRNSRVLQAMTPACRTITRRIHEEIKRYVAALPDEAGHPFLGSRPDEVVVSGWTVIFDGESRHIAHIHPRAWMSGVYYVVQPAVSARPGTTQGWFRAGAPLEYPLADLDTWEERLIEPKPGLLSLMPAYFYHETYPTYSDDERMCIAFDVMPVELAREVLAPDLLERSLVRLPRGRSRATS